MRIEKIKGIFFSPTGSTERVVKAVAMGAAREVTSCTSHANSVEYIDLTLPAARKKDYVFSAGELVIVGCPTYAGRLPNKIMPDLREHLQGRSAPFGVPLVTFGNRSYGDALKELGSIMNENGFTVVAGAAAACRHAFTDKLAEGRPSESDLAALSAFGAQIARHVMEAEANARHVMEAESNAQRVMEAEAAYPADLDILAGQDLDVGTYYTPLKEDGSPAKFLKAKSKADPGKCNRCMFCSAVCPMGSIEETDPFSVTGICIKCQACVRRCPAGARYFDDPDFLSHVRMLEENYQEPKENVYLTWSNRN